jgi:hypothetical protein
VLRGYGVTVETPPWSTVARIKGTGGISLDDSYAAALAVEASATPVVGTPSSVTSRSTSTSI